MLRRLSSIAFLVTLLVAGTPRVALADAFDGCALTGSRLTANTWVSEPLYREGGTDVDWYKFTVTTAGWQLLTLGNLPADYALELWSSCSAVYRSSNRSGLWFEDIYVYLEARTWYVRVTTGAGAYSQTPYQLRWKPLAGTVQVLSSATWLDSSNKLHFAGEVLNNTSSRRTGIMVRASMYSSSNVYLGQLSGPLLRVAMHARRRAPFHIVLTPPAGYHHISNVSPTVGTVPSYWPVTGLTAAQGGPSYASAGLRWFDGVVRNPNTFTAKNVTAVLTLYKPNGAVMNAGKVATSPSTVGPGAEEYFHLGLAGPWWGLPAWDVEASK